MDLFREDQLPAPETRRCSDCKHAWRWQCGSKVICYCRARSSNRTENGLHKTKWRAAACSRFEAATREVEK